MEEKYLSALVLEHAVFDCIEFHRMGFQCSSDLEFNLQIRTGYNPEGKTYKVTLILHGEKEGEYSLKISISGFFCIEVERLPEGVNEENLIKNNAVAILMPYLRSEVSLLTSQPGTECIVMPVFNVNAMLDGES